MKALTESGLIDRKDYGVVPPKVEYRLTRKGKSFVPVIAAIRELGERHLSETAALADGDAQRSNGPPIMRALTSRR